MSRRPVSQLSTSKLLELTGHYNHRLLSMEADLKDLARTGALKPRAYAKRVTQLRRLQQLVNEIEASKSSPNKTPADLSLPLLEHASPPEKQVCVHFFERRERWARSVRGKLELVLRWLDNTIAGKANFLANTFRLSQLHKFVREADRLTAIFQQELKSVDYHIDRMLQQLPKSLMAGTQTADVLAALAEVFRRLDAAVSRVAKLKTSVRFEQQKVGEMRSWLMQREAELASRVETLPAPTPMQTSVAGQQLDDVYDTDISRCQEKLQLAQDFWEKVLDRSRVDQLDPEFLQGIEQGSPASKLNKRERKGARRRQRRRRRHDERGAAVAS